MLDIFKKEYRATHKNLLIFYFITETEEFLDYKYVHFSKYCTIDVSSR